MPEHKPGASRDDLSAAQRDCRERVLAEMRSDSFYRRERAAEQYAGAGSSRIGEESSARQRMQEFGSMKRRDSLFLECMRSKGFSRASLPGSS